MTDIQLNILGVKAKSGDDESRWKVKSYFQKAIHLLSDANRNRLGSQSDFEEECYKIIDDTIDRFDPTLGNLRQLVINFIKRRVGRTTKRYSEKVRKSGFTLVSLTPTQHDDDTLEYDISDDLAIVDMNYLLNERIALLAEGDPRKLAILNEWLWPDNNDSNTAELLAQRFGGNQESHRKSIIRFKKRCQKALADAI